MKLIFSVACTLARFPAKLYPASLCFGTYAKGSFVLITALMTGAQAQSSGYHCLAGYSPPMAHCRNKRGGYFYCCVRAKSVAQFELFDT
jgi:hypothetical protein